MVLCQSAHSEGPALCAQHAPRSLEPEILIALCTYVLQL